MTGKFTGPPPHPIPQELLGEELGELPSLPAQGFLWGELPPRPRVAIVGSRRASPHGLETAKRVASTLAACGVCVVSGGASGIDRAAHEGALQAGGRTLVVGPVWLDVAYPTENRPLFAEVIRRGGGYLTVCDRSAQPLRPFFHRRNAALVCLSECLIIGEAGHTSGALNAAAQARRLGRPRFVLPCLPELSSTRGSECELLARGGIPYFRSKQVLDWLDARTFANPEWLVRRAERVAAQRQGSAGTGVEGRDGPQAIQREGSGGATGSPPLESDSPEPDNPRGRLLSALARGEMTAEQLCQATGLAAEVVQHELLLMTLEGLVGTDRGVVASIPKTGRREWGRAPGRTRGPGGDNR